MKEKAKKESIAVIGDGSWATALIKLLTENHQRIRWWVRKKERITHIKKYGHNPDYLPHVQIIRSRTKPFYDIHKVIQKSSIVILAVPAAYIKNALDQLSPEDMEGKVFITAIKGMIPEDNCLVTEYLEHKFNVLPENISIVAGPCHAEEIAMERQSYLTIGSVNRSLAEEVASLFRCRYVNVNCLNDLSGIEYAAVMKNIVALVCGITHSLSFGDNFQAVLVSNAMQEIKYFLDKHYPAERDLNASAYLGDLLVTAYSQFSRNRTFGSQIGRGYSVKTTMLEMKMVAEGYYAVKSIYERFAKEDEGMPITTALYHILYERISPAIEIQLLKEKLK